MQEGNDLPDVNQYLEVVLDPAEEPPIQDQMLDKVRAYIFVSNIVYKYLIVYFIFNISWSDNNCDICGRP